MSTHPIAEVCRQGRMWLPSWLLSIQEARAHRAVFPKRRLKAGGKTAGTVIIQGELGPLSPLGSPVPAEFLRRIRRLNGNQRGVEGEHMLFPLCPLSAYHTGNYIACASEAAQTGCHMPRVQQTVQEPEACWTWEERGSHVTV